MQQLGESAREIAYIDVATKLSLGLLIESLRERGRLGPIEACINSGEPLISKKGQSNG